MPSKKQRSKAKKQTKQQPKEQPNKLSDKQKFLLNDEFITTQTQKFTAEALENNMPLNDICKSLKIYMDLYYEEVLEFGIDSDIPKLLTREKFINTFNEYVENL